MEKDNKHEIKITGKALDYLRKKDKAAVVIEYPDYRINGDFAVVPVPEIFARRPKAEEGYNKVTVEKIDVYISKTVHMPENRDVVIDVDSFLKMRFLTLSGFSVKD